MIKDIFPLSVCASKTGSNNGAAHIYLVDKNGRKVAAIWGKENEKYDLADILSSAPEMYDTLKFLYEEFKDYRRFPRATVSKILTKIGGENDAPSQNDRPAPETAGE